MAFHLYRRAVAEMETEADMTAESGVAETGMEGVVEESSAMTTDPWVGPGMEDMAQGPLPDAMETENVNVTDGGGGAGLAAPTG